MGKAYSMDLRERVVASCDKGERPEKLADRYQVSARWIYTLLNRRKETGSIAPLQGKTGPKLKLAEHQDQVLQVVQAHPDATLDELREELPVQVSKTTMWRALRNLGMTLKKSHPRRRAATA